MMKFRIDRHGIFAVLVFVVLAACSKKEAPLPDNFVNFEASSQGITSSEESYDLKIKLTAAAPTASTLVLAVAETGVVYGTDYTTTPAVSGGTVSLNIPAGATEAILKIEKVPTALFDGDEKIDFTINSVTAPLILGQTKTLTLSFDELLAETGSATIDGGGPTYPNKVFIDLSANRQTAVLRSKWDLGFYMEAGGFNVILNSSSNMMAKKLDKSSLADVSATDTVGFAADVAFSQTAPSVSQLGYIDYPSGDLTKTAIAPVAANADDNKVYIINRGVTPGSPGTAKGWKKVKITRNASGGYTVQHADIAATTFQETVVGKDDAYFFKYISFEDGVLTVEPEKTKWDIAWTYFANVTNFGGGEVPYLFQDIILQNRNVEVARVMTDDKAFDAFTEANIAGLSFSSSQIAIGADWRAGGGPSTPPSINTNRYYIVKDGAGNYYKLRFTALTQNNERGYPAFESVLVKKA